MSDVVILGVMIALTPTMLVLGWMLWRLR